MTASERWLWGWIAAELVYLRGMRTVGRLEYLTWQADG